ncbi:putative transporter [Lipomyces kononenkoae]|uniref:Transporter n=1 Tax=Lipomyces kononenkoae TaxID=34357 RepID=A0ACC3SQ26_LIPKO
MAEMAPISMSLSQRSEQDNLKVELKKSENVTEIDIGPGTVEDLDDAEVFLRDNGISHGRLRELLDDKDAQKRLLRRVDLTLLPLLCGTYMLQYLDKQVLSYSAVFDLFSSTGISSAQYSWLVSIFYFAYLGAEWPLSYLAQHYATGTIISIFTICWGIILACTATCSNFATLAVCRFILGIFEAVITPSFLLIIGTWYTRQEQPARVGAFTCFIGVGSMAGGILFVATGQSKGWDIWRTNFVLCGGITILWGVILLIFLPNSIFAAKRFTLEEKAMLIARSQTNNTGVYSRTIKWGHVKQALSDVQVWLLFLFVLLNETINGGIASFGKLIVQGFTDSAILTTAYGIPYGAWCTFFMFTGPWIASRLKDSRTTVMVLYVLPTLIASCLFWKLPRTNQKGLLMAYYICPSYTGACFLALQMPSANFGGYTKRVTGSAIVFLAYCTGNIVGPHAFIASEAPIYQTGCKVIIGCVVGQIVIALLLRALLIRRNKKRDTDASLSEYECVDETLQDVTDFENKNFRYVY